MFPNRAPIYTCTGILLSLLAIGASLFLWWRLASPLQRYYLSPATSFVYLTTALPRPQTPKPYPIYNLAQFHMIITTPSAAHRYWATWVYGGGLDVAMRWPLLISGDLAAVFIIGGALLDQHRRKTRREGVPLRGPSILTPRQYNRKTKGDGIEIQLV